MSRPHLAGRIDPIVEPASPTRSVAGFSTAACLCGRCIQFPRWPCGRRGGRDRRQARSAQAGSSPSWSTSNGACPASGEWARACTSAHFAVRSFRGGNQLRNGAAPARQERAVRTVPCDRLPVPVSYVDLRVPAHFLSGRRGRDRAQRSSSLDASSSNGQIVHSAFSAERISRRRTRAARCVCAGLIASLRSVPSAASPREIVVRHAWVMCVRVYAGVRVSLGCPQ